jgi:hypothetical protein
MIPHFNFPFHLDADRHVSEVEQDTVDDVVVCAALAFITEQGTRLEAPTFGVAQEVFSLQPIDVEGMVDAISQWDDRIEMVFDQNPGAQDKLIAQVQIAASYRSAEDA